MPYRATRFGKHVHEDVANVSASSSVGTGRYAPGGLWEWIDTDACAIALISQGYAFALFCLVIIAAHF